MFIRVPEGGSLKEEKECGQSKDGRNMKTELCQLYILFGFAGLFSSCKIKWLYQYNAHFSFQKGNAVQFLFLSKLSETSILSHSFFVPSLANLVHQNSVYLAEEKKNWPVAFNNCSASHFVIRMSADLVSPYKVEFPIHTMYSVTIMDSIYSEGMLCKFGKVVSKSRAERSFDKTRNQTYTWSKHEGN